MSKLRLVGWLGWITVKDTVFADSAPSLLSNSDKAYLVSHAERFAKSALGGTYLGTLRSCLDLEGT